MINKKLNKNESPSQLNIKGIFQYLCYKLFYLKFVITKKEFFFKYFNKKMFKAYF